MTPFFMYPKRAIERSALNRRGIGGFPIPVVQAYGAYRNGDALPQMRHVRRIWESDQAC